jgi:hypothetical protein
MAKKSKNPDDSNNPMDAIIFAASTYKTLEEVGVDPSPKNMALYRRIKNQVTEIRNSGQGVILPN